MQAVDASRAGIERRRSERVFQSAPVIVRGVDPLSEPFEERTTTLAFNSGRVPLLIEALFAKERVGYDGVGGMGLTVQREGANSWIQRPHSVREYFQIAVESESFFWIFGRSTLLRLTGFPKDGRHLHRSIVQPERITVDEPRADSESLPQSLLSWEEFKRALPLKTFSDSFANPEESSLNPRPASKALSCGN